jgi:hypothetical protein
MPVLIPESLLKKEGELVEGGGLGSLRRKVENQGGSMVISCAPEFALTITVPKDWSEIP